MSLKNASILTAGQFSDSEIETIFALTRQFKDEFQRKKRIDHLVESDGLRQRIVSLAFFEPSTRTRLSFQTAAYRLGVKTVSLDNLSVSSMSKGESQMDTVKNLVAMQPDALVVRYGTSQDMDEVIRKLEVPVINGGSGIQEHPTQALLDAFTIKEAKGKIAGEKVLIIGDVVHSRVANSNLTMLRRLGAEVAICAPEEFTPHNKEWNDVKVFSDVNSGIRWASVCMCLRIQKERHTMSNIGLSMAAYRERYRLGSAQLKLFDKDGIILHPGPAVRGVEISSRAMEDSRSRILTQVQNGVFLRAALIALILGLEVRRL